MITERLRFLKMGLHYNALEKVLCVQIRGAINKLTIFKEDTDFVNPYLFK